MQSNARTIGWVLLVGLGGLTIGCKKDPEPISSATPTVSAADNQPIPFAPTPPAGAGGTAQQHPVAVVWDDPSEWSKLPPRGAMRRATYKIPSAKGDPDGTEVAVFYFGPGQGGGVETNVERWAGQFGLKKDDVKRSNRRVNDLEQYIVEIPKGTYKPDMFNKNSKGLENWSMLAAIVEAPSGSYFFKLAGPTKTVEQARPVFFKMLDGVRTGP